MPFDRGAQVISVAGIPDVTMKSHIALGFRPWVVGFERLPLDRKCGLGRVNRARREFSTSRLERPDSGGPDLRLDSWLPERKVNNLRAQSNRKPSECCHLIPAFTVGS